MTVTFRMCRVDPQGPQPERKLASCFAPVRPGWWGRRRRAGREGRRGAPVVGIGPRRRPDHFSRAIAAAAINLHCWREELGAERSAGPTRALASSCFVKWSWRSCVVVKSFRLRLGVRRTNT